MTDAHVMFEGSRGNGTEPDDAQFSTPSLIDRLLSNREWYVEHLGDR